MQTQAPAPDGSDLGLACTGAAWHLEARGWLTGSSLIPHKRSLLRLRLDSHNEGWEIQGTGPQQAQATRASVTVTLHDDSLLVLRTTHSLELEIETLFAPEYAHSQQHDIFLADPTGGYALHLRGKGQRRGNHWTLAPHSELWISVFPPRWPNTEHLSWSLAHEGRPRPFPSATLPSNAIIDAAAEHCRVLTVHAYFWQGVPLRERPKFSRYVWRRSAWRSRLHVPVDPEELARVRERCTTHGLKLLLYVSPLYSQAPDIISELERIHQCHGADGFYLDGLSSDLARARELARGARSIIGDDGLLYLNSSEHPFPDPRLPCPLVDTHADFVLRGSAGKRGLPLRTFLRYAVSGWHLSQAIGVWCHYGSSGWPLDRVPSATHVQAALDEHVRIWRRSHWPAIGRGMDAFDQHYDRGLSILAQSEREQLKSL